MGYKKSNWSEDELDFLKNNYLKYSYPELSVIMNRSRSAIQHKISRLELHKSKYDNTKKIFNENYFENIDNDEKAYWLGFIAADGTIYHDCKNNSYRLKISLQESDNDFLSKFLKSISANFGIKHKQTKLNNKFYKYCEVAFTSKKMVLDLHKYLEFRKTYNMYLPKINERYTRDFIRGFIDGDGCFYINHNNSKKHYMEIVSYGDTILKQFQHEFEKHNIKSVIYEKKNGNKKLGVYANNSLYMLHHYLYDGATIFMERKYKKSLKMLKVGA